MARGKKKESALTPEEKLAQALVPDWEWPYKVPENWCWTRLSHVAKWGSGGTPSRKNPEYYEGDIPWIKTGELNDDYIYETEEHISDEAVAHSSVKLFPINTVAIAMYGATIGKVGILGVEATTNQACACAVASQAIDYKYLFRFAQSQKDAFIKKGKGGAQPNISQEIIKEHEIPLPPIAEQRRIVNRIEYLFAKLDEAKEKAQSVLGSFETRKAAILHKAFTGELTAKWRVENGISLESWNKLTLNDVAAYKKGPFGSSITKAMFVPKGENTYKVYEQGNAIRKTLDYGHYYISLPKYEELKSFAVAPGDILISCAGTIGEAYKLPENCEAGVINQALMRVRIYPNIHEQFFLHYFGGVVKGDVIDKANGTAIQNIPPFKVMKAMEIHLPSIEEQTEIVRILDSLFAKEQQAKEAAEAVLEKIDLLKKSILARAFRGELGTNDPTEESALELLMEVIRGN
jgi:type I restriction enzyme S subunit